MKIIKANKIFTVFRGLILLALGLFQVVVGLIGMNSKGTSDGSAAQQFAGIFIALFSAIGMILVITGAITVLYSFFVFGNIKRTRRGISRGFLFIDVIANIIAVALAVVVLFADGEDANVYACILLLALAIVGFAFDAVAFRALKAVRGESYGIEQNLSRSKGYKAFSVLGVLFGIIPSVAFAVFVLSINNYYGESEYDIPVMYAALAAVCLSAVFAIAASVAVGKGKGGASGTLLTISSIASCALVGIAFSASVWLAVIACIGLALLAVAGMCALAESLKRKREAERNALRFERDYMRAHRDR